MKNGQRMEFYGGLFGAVVPFLSLIIVMIVMTIKGYAGLEYAWSAGLVALSMALFLAKKKKDVHDVAISSLTDPMFGTITIIFLLAGVLSHMLRQSGLVNGLIWLCESLNVNPGIFPVATFLICVLTSTACGTQWGTISMVTPVMFPLAVSMGCNPGVMLGAIISGGVFGDNLAPISDTTIASSGAMHAEVSDVVKSRMKYSLIAAGFAAVMFTIFGISTTDGSIVAAGADASNAKTLIMLVIPFVMIFMMAKKSSLIPVLMVCNIIAFVLNIGMGFVTLTNMIGMDGPIVKGMSGMATVVIFNMFIIIQNGFLRASGIYDALLEKLGSFCRNARQMELLTMVFVACVVVFAVSGTVSIIIAGPIVYELFKKFNIDRHRGANYLDGTACGVAALLPWNDAVLGMLGIAAATELLPAGFSALNFIPYTFHPMALVVVYLFCAVTGIFRKSDAANYADEITE